MSVALPSKLLYQTKVESAAARSFRSNIAPQNGTGNYYVGDTITINIPTRNNLVLVPSDSYLKFTATIKNGATSNKYIRLDSGGAHGFIQKIRVFHGSNLLSDIDNYNVLAKMMMDIQVPSDATYGKLSVLAGTRPDLSVGLPDITAGATYTQADMTILDLFQTTALQTNGGAKLNTTSISGSTGTVSGTYCISLMSLIGTLCSEKYIPLFAMTSAPLKVEIVLVSNALNAVCSEQTLDSTAPLTISNCEYVAQMIELSDAAMSTIYSQTNGPLQFVFTDYRNYSSTANGNTSTTAVSSFTVPVAAKFSSLKSLFVALRDSSKTQAVTYFPHSSNKFNIQEYSFRVGSQVLPSKNPNNSTEMFAELIKAIASLGDLNHQPSIDVYSYNMDYPLANNDNVTAGILNQTNSSINSGSFYIGLDLENYTSADRSSIFAGWNSNTDDIYFNPIFGTNTAATLIRFDAYAMFDSVLVCENNTAYVKF